MGRKVFPGTEISLADRRDLGDRDNFYPIWTQLSRLAGKLSVYTLQNLHHSGKLYPVSGKTFLHMNRTTLFDLSKCFLGNRDDFCPYEQALKVKNISTYKISRLFNGEGTNFREIFWYVTRYVYISGGCGSINRNNMNKII